ncbi:MAG: prepilin-type N-terminal cleavage/methylation domain-containing protein [Planctomycetota bacterium]
MSVSRKKGFTLIELLVVVAIIALLISILLPSLARAREIAKRAVCAANLRAIGQSAKTYANENRDEFPTSPYKEPTTIITNNTHVVNFVRNMGREITRGSTTGGIDTGQVHPSRSMFLMVIDGSCTSKSFICPSSGDQDDDMRNKFGNTETAANPGVNRFDFRGYPFVSYGYQLPFGPRARPNELLDTRMAMLADKGPFFQGGSSDGWVTADTYANKPGGSGQYGSTDRIQIQGAGTPELVLQADNDRWRPYNSRNHSSEGQNVLFVDSHVEFVKKPIAGVNFDNIYTWQYSYTLLDTLLGNVPADQKGPYTSTDSIIVP